MTDTYPKDAPYDVKLLEEIRCTRCALERILNAIDAKGFVDYELEKFGNAPKFPEPKE